jgi:hypothetical protein
MEDQQVRLTGKKCGQIAEKADEYLLTITSNSLRSYLQKQGEELSEDLGTTLLSNIYHYWFHLGESHAIRQVLGHTNLPQYVGNMTKVNHSISNE